MNENKLNILFILSILITVILLMMMACSKDEPIKVSDAEAQARLKVAESERNHALYSHESIVQREIERALATNEGRKANSDYVPAETLSWDHEANYEHGWNYFSVSPQYNSLYMGVHLITDKTSPQWHWFQTHFWDYDEEGICIYDDRILVALTPEFGDVGDYVDLLLADGTVLKTIICDVKWNADKYGHNHGEWTNVLEIIVSPEWYETGHENKYYPDVIAYRRMEYEHID